jgi:hypothetical protein
MAGQRRDNLVGDGFDIERFGQCGHAWTLSEVLEGANGHKSASRAHVRSGPSRRSLRRKRVSLIGGIAVTPLV